MDESIHGVAVGFFAQNIFKTFPTEKQQELTLWGYEYLLDLYQNEMKYTDDLYAETGLSPEVKKYVRYNKFLEENGITYSKSTKIDNKPTKEELLKLLENNSKASISRMFGVTWQAVNKWCKKYGI
mgnify:CR=1 FL=1